MADDICRVIWSFSCGTNSILLIENNYSLNVFNIHLLRVYYVSSSFLGMAGTEVNRVGEVVLFVMLT